MIHSDRLFRRTASAAAATALLSMLACKEPQLIAGSGPPSQSAVAQLVVTPKFDSVQIAEPAQLTATALDSSGHPMTAAIEWSASGGVVDSAGHFAASAPGTYWVRARHRHQPPVTDSGTVVVVPPTLRSLVLAPASASLLAGASRQFSVSGSWSDGSSTAPSVDYSATGGTITVSGLYTAGSSAGSYRVIARQHNGTRADTSSVQISLPAATLTGINLTPATATLSPGASRQFSVSGTWSDGSNTSPAVSYSATGGTITSAGLYTAGTGAGSFRIIAVAQGYPLADTASVTIAAAPVTLTALTLSPASASLAVAATRQFAVSALWSDGSTTAPTVNYSATGGTISGAGLYTAGNTAGAFRVIATAQGLPVADTAAITITATPVTLTALTLTPPTASLVTGTTRQFTVSALWSDGSTTVPVVNYSATGGTITGGGLFTAGQTAGSYRVIVAASSGGKADTSAVTITAPVLTQLTLTPPAVSLSTGGSQQFSVAGTWSNGATTLPTVTWSATGGTISSSGLFIAGTTAGSYRVIAAQSGGTLRDTSTVTITGGTGNSVVLLQENFEDAAFTGRGWFGSTIPTTAAEHSSGAKAMEWHWTPGLTTMLSGARRNFTPSNSVYLSYWVKESSNWIGSGVTYHPHMFHFLTTTDDQWIGPSHTHLTLYDELIYRPAQGGSSAHLAIQDALMIDPAKLMVDLTHITENRAIGGYNGRPEAGLTWEAYLDGSEGYTNYKVFQPNTVVMTDATKNSWHHVESYWQMNSISNGLGQPDGVVQYWFDGALLIDRHDIYFRTGANPTMQFRTFVMAPYIGVGSPIDQYMWIDNVEVRSAKP